MFTLRSLTVFCNTSSTHPRSNCNDMMCKNKHYILVLSMCFLSLPGVPICVQANTRNIFKSDISLSKFPKKVIVVFTQKLCLNSESCIRPPLTLSKLWYPLTAMRSWPRGRPVVDLRTELQQLPSGWVLDRSRLPATDGHWRWFQLSSYSFFFQIRDQTTPFPCLLKAARSLCQLDLAAGLFSVL